MCNSVANELSYRRSEIMATVVAEGELQICKKCGREIGSDEAKKCSRCHSLICPYCNECNCSWVDSLFGGMRDPLFA